MRNLLVYFACIFLSTITVFGQNNRSATLGKVFYSAAAIIPLSSGITISGKTPVCSGDTLKLTASAVEVDSYKWSRDRDFTPDSIIVEGNVMSVLHYVKRKYYVQVAIRIGGPIIDSIEVDVYLPPIVSISGDASICPGKKATLTAGGADSYTWRVGAAGLGLTTPTVDVWPTGNTTYIARGTTSATGCWAEANFDVTINPQPALPVISSPSSVCLGDRLG